MAKGKLNSRAKGAAAEREAAEWLASHFSLSAKPERNLEQVRSGGYDLIGFEPFAFEIKRCEALTLRDWWLQAVTGSPRHLIPVVMYRQNRQPWRFLISARAIGNKNGYILLEAREFIEWAQRQLNGYST